MSKVIEYKGKRIIPREIPPSCPYCNVPMKPLHPVWTEEFWVCPKDDKHKLLLTFGAKIVE